jgi:hypothetical protein
MVPHLLMCMFHHNYAQHLPTLRHPLVSHRVTVLDLDYLHAGLGNVIVYFRDNIYIIKHLRNFNMSTNMARIRVWMSIKRWRILHTF